MINNVDCGQLQRFIIVFDQTSPGRFRFIYYVFHTCVSKQNNSFKHRDDKCDHPLYIRKQCIYQAATNFCYSKALQTMTTILLQWYIGAMAWNTYKELHVGIANPRRRGKRSRHSRCMHNPQVCVFGKRPMENGAIVSSYYFWPRTYRVLCNVSFMYSTSLPLDSQSHTSTVYWCIASKLKAPRNFYWMSNMFLWVEIFLFFVCYHVVPKRHSQLDYELNGL